MTRAELAIIAVMLLGASILPTAVYGLTNPNSWTYLVARFVFALK